MSIRTLARVLFVALLAVAPTATFAGGVSGSAVFIGAEKPSRTEIKMGADPFCAKHNAGKKIGTEDFLINKDRQIKNVFVYLSAGVTGKSEPPKESVLLDQVGCMYVPHVVGVQVNQPLSIKNSDETLHNVHCLSKANPEFNFGQPTKDSVKDKTFRKVEKGVKIKCDVHPWMGAWLFVLDHPYFAVTDAEGKFTIPNVPAGKYTVTAWHEKLGETSKEIEVGDADVAGLSFEFDVK